jgi:hypothetical protein
MLLQPSTMMFQPPTLIAMALAAIVICLSGGDVLFLRYRRRPRVLTALARTRATVSRLSTGGRGGSMA